MGIRENVLEIRAEIAKAAQAAGRAPDEILLVAASKMNPSEKVQEAILAGIDAAGENRVQEMCQKLEQGAYVGAPLHFIGHLQKNKVRQVVGVCDLIESIDSIPLMQLVNKRAQQLGIVQDILIEVNIGKEAGKAGVFPESLEEMLNAAAGLSAIFVRGLMAIPPISQETCGNCGYFMEMHKLFVDIRKKTYDNIRMDFLSMGMSGDFYDAILAGANIVRIGSRIFGNRNYI